MTREEAKKYLLQDIGKHILEEGEDAIAMMAPQRGKCIWTWKEMKKAVLEDKDLEGGGGNPIDDLLKYEEYRVEHGMKSLFENKKAINREQQLEERAERWFCEGDHTGDGILATYKEGLKNAEENPDSTFAWAIYNFINDYKEGKFGEVILQEALDNNFKEWAIKNHVWE